MYMTKIQCAKTRLYCLVLISFLDLGASFTRQDYFNFKHLSQSKNVARPQYPLSSIGLRHSGSSGGNQPHNPVEVDSWRIPKIPAPSHADTYGVELDMKRSYSVPAIQSTRHRITLRHLLHSETEPSTPHHFYGIDEESEEEKPPNVENNLDFIHGNILSQDSVPKHYEHLERKPSKFDRLLSSYHGIHIQRLKSLKGSFRSMFGQLWWVLWFFSPPVHIIGIGVSLRLFRQIFQTPYPRISMLSISRSPADIACSSHIQEICPVS